MIRAVDMGSVFALARYAAEKAKPLVDQIPGGSLSVEANIDDKWGLYPWSVGISVHRVIRDHHNYPALAPMTLQETYLTDTDQVDAVITELRRIAEAGSWALDKSEMDAA